MNVFATYWQLLTRIVGVAYSIRSQYVDWRSFVWLSCEIWAWTTSVNVLVIHWYHPPTKNILGSIRLNVSIMSPRISVRPSFQRVQAQYLQPCLIYGSFFKPLTIFVALFCIFSRHRPTYLFSGTVTTLLIVGLHNTPDGVPSWVESVGYYNSKYCERTDTDMLLYALHFIAAPNGTASEQP